MGTPDAAKSTDEPPEPRATRAPAWMMLLVVLALVAATIAFASWVDTDPAMVGPALGPTEPAGDSATPATGSVPATTSSIPATSADAPAGTPSTATGP